MFVTRLLSAFAALPVVLALSAVPASADPIDVQSLLVLKNINHENGAVSPDGYQFEIQLTAAGVTSASVQLPTETVNLADQGGGTWSYDKRFATKSDLDTYFADSVASVSLTINGGSSLINVPYATGIPISVPTITYPTQNANGVPLDPTYQWSSQWGFCNFLHLEVSEGETDQNVYMDFLETDTTKTSWQPGSLTAGIQYWFDVAGVNGTSTTQFTSTSDSFDYFMAYANSNGVNFNTVPEPVTLTLLGSGLLILFRRRRAA